MLVAQFEAQRERLLGVRGHMEVFRNSLGDSWCATEIETINLAIAVIINELNGLAGELGSLAHGIKAEAPNILRRQQLATAQAELQTAENRLQWAIFERDRAVQSRNNSINRIGQASPAQIARVESTQRRVNELTAERNAAASRVRDLQ